MKKTIEARILKITKDDLDERGYYAASESLEFDGSIEIHGNLGLVQFRAKLFLGRQVSQCCVSCTG